MLDRDCGRVKAHVPETSVGGPETDGDTSGHVVDDGNRGEGLRTHERAWKRVVVNK